MKTIEVAAGVIYDAHGRVLLCCRTGELDGLWEFPGGKREAGESLAECLRRELLEELELSVEVGEMLGEHKRMNADDTLRLVFLRAEAGEEAKLSLHVHAKAEWVEPSKVADYPLCPADQAFWNVYGK